ncbi:hypothetical protein [Enhygromyxa salina]|nr:hypothetical protein [Enhygromyxa salina]
MRCLSFALALPVALALGGGAGCYTVDFDETLSNVYYCQAVADCGANQACWQNRCVDDSGPVVTVTGPESLQNLTFDAQTLTVNYSTSNFTISDSNEVVEGEGKIAVSVAGTDISTVSVVSAGAQLDISSLEPGAYRLLVEAVHGDGTPYDNPSASTYTVFYIEDQNPLRPQVAIVSPPPGYVHIVGEPLEVVIASRNFEFVDSGEDCRIDPSCDPWGPMGTPVPDGCLPACPVVPAGHPHIYMLSDYPACLDNALSCNGDYVLSLLSGDSTGDTVTGVIPADRFTEVGTVTFSAGLQYNDHEPYPHENIRLFDQITIELAER